MYHHLDRSFICGDDSDLSLDLLLDVEDDTGSVIHHIPEFMLDDDEEETGSVIHRCLDESFSDDEEETGSVIHHTFDGAYEDVAPVIHHFRPSSVHGDEDKENASSHGHDHPTLTGISEDADDTGSIIHRPCVRTAPIPRSWPPRIHPDAKFLRLTYEQRQEVKVTAAYVAAYFAMVPREAHRPKSKPKLRARALYSEYDSNWTDEDEYNPES